MPKVLKGKAFGYAMLQKCLKTAKLGFGTIKNGFPDPKNGRTHVPGWTTLLLDLSRRSWDPLLQ